MVAGFTAVCIVHSAYFHNEAVARIRDMITEGRLEPGSKVSEKDLCQLFGISRTPLREALKVLASEGLSALLPDRGARVAQLTGKDMADLFQVMGALEGLAGDPRAPPRDAGALHARRSQRIFRRQPSHPRS